MTEQPNFSYSAFLTEKENVTPLILKTPDLEDIEKEIVSKDDFSLDYIRVGMATLIARLKLMDKQMIEINNHFNNIDTCLGLKQINWLDNVLSHINYRLSHLEEIADLKTKDDLVESRLSPMLTSKKGLINLKK